MYYDEHKNEIYGILFLLLGLLLFISLISYTPFDIPFLSYPYNTPVKNWISTVGAYLGFFLRFLFGYASFGITGLFIYWAVVRILKLDDRLNVSGSPNVVALLFFLFFSASLFSVLAGYKRELAFSLGGLCGYVFSRFLFTYFGKIGAWIIVVGLFALSFIMLTRLSILTVVRFMSSPLLWVGRWVTGLWTSIGSFQKKKKGKGRAILFNERPDKKLLLDETVEQDLELEDQDLDADEIEQDLSEDQESIKEELFEEDDEQLGSPKKKLETKDNEKRLERACNDLNGNKSKELTDEGKNLADETELGFDLRANEGRKVAPPKKGKYKLPPIDLLDIPLRNKKEKENVKEKARVIEQSLAEFNIPVKVINVESGPVITRYELEPAPGVKIQKIVNLADDLALNLRANSIRIVAPIPGKAAVGIEVPNSYREPVFLRDIVSSAQFKESNSPLTIGLGKDTAGYPVVADLRDMPHLLIAGATGSGKTVCVNALITSMLMKASPEQLRFILVDPKMVEMTQYNKLPHLLCPVVTDVKKVSCALNWLIAEMEKRYQILAREGVRNIRFYNQRHKSDPMPYIVLIIDELADIMAVAQSEVETGIARLAQLSRAVGIHLILATQRPSVDVITGVIKANFPARISFKVASRVDSRTVLDTIGAEKLLGRGDMLFMKPGAVKIQRIQGCYVQDREIERVVEFICAQADQQFDESVIKAQKKSSRLREKDELFDEAVDIILTTGQASVSILQRRMRLGYARAARLIDMMEEEGIVGPYRGSKPREILIDRQQWLRRKEGFDVAEN